MAPPGAPATPIASEDRPANKDIIVTGTRRTDRSVLDSSVPVDVVGARELRAVSSSDLVEKVAFTVPSYTVQTRPFYGSQIFIRTAVLRNLGADDTLVLVNGKRQHRSAFVNFHIFGAAAHEVDISQIPSEAINRVEVLRDGASAQYGSDAIAGVVNLILKDKPGYSAFVQTGQYYAGDGLGVQAGLNAGWKLGNRGHLNVTLEYTKSDTSSRSLQRAEAAKLIAAGNTNIADPVEIWGDPASELYRVAYNGEYELAQDVTFYSFGLYGHSSGKSNSHWRSPNNAIFRRSIFQNAPYNLYPTYDAKARFPGGLVPISVLTGSDISLAAGLRGELSGALSYDASVNWGSDRIHLGAEDTINASLGPLSPTRFDNGVLRSSELDAGVDFVYKLDAGLVSPINIAFGAEYRLERYGASVGDEASYIIGPFADIQSGSNGTALVTPDAVGSWSRPSEAVYIDTDIDLSRRLNIGVAARFEHYSDFGSTLNGKASGRFAIVDGFSLRGSVSTGFRAPTPGQIHARNTSTTPDFTKPGQQVVTSLLPAISPEAIALGALPLKPVRSFDISVGTVVQPLPGVSLTIDYYNVTLRDRLTASQTFGTNPRYNFFVNGYKTRTTGVDIVASYNMHLGDNSNLVLTAAGNYNDTKILKFNAGVISPAQKLYFERKVPRYSGVVSADYSRNRLEFLVRGRYYGSLVDIFVENIAYAQRVGAEFFVDLSASYRITDHLKLSIGADNVLDNYPDKAIYGGVPNAVNTQDFGRLYPSSLPYSFNGGRYYARASVTF